MLIRMGWQVSLLLLLLLQLVHQGEGAADRLCCRYRCEGEGGCPPWCASQNSCLIKNGTELVEDAACHVTVDTKKDFTSMESRLTCLQQNFKSGESFYEPPFYLAAYRHSGGLGQPAFTGLDLRVQYNAFQNLRFRFKNLNPNVCPEPGLLTKDTSCNPRCVEVERTEGYQSGHLALHSGLEFSYDCEVGFYISKDSKLWIEATKDSYLLSVCATSADPEEAGTHCGEYLFLMPGPAEVARGEYMMLLVDKLEYDTRNSFVLYILPPADTDLLLITLLSLGEEDVKTPVYNQTEQVEAARVPGSIVKVRLDHAPPSGRYQVAVSALSGDQQLVVSYSSPLVVPPNHLHLVILAITAAVILLGLLLALYKRWHQVAEEGAVEPQVLVDAGRIQPKPVLVITSLHNTKHSQIVKDLCEYLRKWCGVGATYFPLDDEVGIHRGQRDPWKWCQESFERVKEEGGSLVFVAGPSPSLSSSSVYPGLQDNQAFLATKDLRALAQQGRVVVCRLPYSSLKSLPSEVPAHLTSQPVSLPGQMNTFLSHLLQVKRKSLCWWAPCSLVQPEILPGDLTRPGGPQILQAIKELTAQDSQARMEQAALTQARLMQRFLPGSKGGEEQVKPANGHQQQQQALLPPIIRARPGQTDEDREAGQPLVSPPGDVLQLELEPGLPSLRDLAYRDRAVDPSA